MNGWYGVSNGGKKFGPQMPTTICTLRRANSTQTANSGEADKSRLGTKSKIGMSNPSCLSRRMQLDVRLRLNSHSLMVLYEDNTRNINTLLGSVKM